MTGRGPRADRPRSGAALVFVMIATVLVAAAAQLSYVTLGAAVDASVTAWEGSRARSLADSAEVLLRAAWRSGTLPEAGSERLPQGTCAFTCSPAGPGRWRAVCLGRTRAGWETRVELLLRRDREGFEVLERTER